MANETPFAVNILSLVLVTVETRGGEGRSFRRFRVTTDRCQHDPPMARTRDHGTVPRAEGSYLTPTSSRVDRLCGHRGAGLSSRPASASPSSGRVGATETMAPPRLLQRELCPRSAGPRTWTSNRETFRMQGRCSPRHVAGSLTVGAYFDSTSSRSCPDAGIWREPKARDAMWLSSVVPPGRRGQAPPWSWAYLPYGGPLCRRRACCCPRQTTRLGVSSAGWRYVSDSAEEPRAFEFTSSGSGTEDSTRILEAPSARRPIRSLRQSANGRGRAPAASSSWA